MTKILDKNAEILRQVAKPVLVKDIRTKKISDLIEKMKQAMHTQDDGVAIAAPQIGESVRIFMVNGEFANSESDLVFINPEILKLSRKKVRVEEGCLSVRYLYGWIYRSEKAKVRAYNEKGEKFEMGGSGLLAQIFQHEIDHLNGILFIDTAEGLRDIPPQKNAGKKN